jgi:hypothetical protein
MVIIIEMETVALFERKISLTSRDINLVTGSSVNEIIIEKLRKNIEGKCSEHGFVLPNTLKILSRSMGYYEAGNFTGDTIYYCKAEAKVVNSVEDLEVIAKVIRKNKMGLYAEYKDALRIIVPRDLHLGNDEFESVEIGDEIRVNLKKSKYQVNDLFILVSALFLGKFINSDGVTESKSIE